MHDYSQGKFPEIFDMFILVNRKTPLQKLVWPLNHNLVLDFKVVKFKILSMRLILLTNTLLKCL